ncbi:MAG: radical SAM protein [Candidatus Aenigmatarchaeota archaeon]
MKIALVQPNYNIQRMTGAWAVNPPIGLAYIAAVLIENDFDVEIIDANALNLNTKQTARKLKNFDIVGFSLMTPAHKFAVDLVKSPILRRKLKIAGGPHATGFPDELLRAGFDIAVRGEGEQTMLEIVQGKKLSKIKGISYRKGRKIVHNPDREPSDPNKIPFPARDLLPSRGVDQPYVSAVTQYRPWSPIITSRGCPFNCNFCNKKIFGYAFRARTPENVVNEIKLLVNKYGVKEIDIYDDCFNFDLERAEKILDLIIKRKIKVKIRCSNGLRADRVNERFLKKLKKAGCIYIAYGIETGNQRVLERIPKMETLDQIRKAVVLTKKMGITVCGFFVFGLLGDTKETMQQTIDFAKELPLDLGSFNIATPYPGTRLYDIVKKEGKFLMSDWDIFHHTSGKMIFTHPDVAPPEEVEDAYRRAHREFYMRPTYVLNKFLKIRGLKDVRIMWRGVRGIIKVHST